LIYSIPVASHTATSGPNCRETVTTRLQAGRSVTERGRPDDAVIPEGSWFIGFALVALAELVCAASGLRLAPFVMWLIAALLAVGVAVRGAKLLGTLKVSQLAER
jgi:hypothetical protein